LKKEKTYKLIAVKKMLIGIFEFLLSNR